MAIIETYDNKSLFHKHVKQWSETEYDVSVNITRDRLTYWVNSVHH